MSLKYCILTIQERCRCGLSQSSICPLCSANEESILHMMRDCPSMKGSWLKVIPSALTRSFFMAPLFDWVMDNLTNKDNFLGMVIPWAIFFLTFIWQIWKRRNCFVFNDSSHGIDDTLHHSISWSTHIEACRQPTTPPRARQPTLTMWQPSIHVQHCLNIDASVDVLSGLGSVVGVLRTRE
ncbi:hypothetical protein F3Y22_tig00112293pilonHSYRG00078 [Hibiscus syriacus]|uniref:Reverse transcriptase zinc-binding domain-containing protein n=1 Tax=Hibiscus syriacus TaxID=106335 RepID=A0A6A2X1G2_HIBSY|nr:hypothetical protein F3Y22_tig00112293pilonHSYRG00078 [Hibiscus syriacus]